MPRFSLAGHDHSLSRRFRGDERSKIKFSPLLPRLELSSVRSICRKPFWPRSIDFDQPARCRACSFTSVHRQQRSQPHPTMIPAMKGTKTKATTNTKSIRPDLIERVGRRGGEHRRPSRTIGILVGISFARSADQLARQSTIAQRARSAMESGF